MRTNTEVVKAFEQGKTKKQGANQSTGEALYLFALPFLWTRSGRSLPGKK